MKLLLCHMASGLTDGHLNLVDSDEFNFSCKSLIKNASQNQRVTSISDDHSLLVDFFNYLCPKIQEEVNTFSVVIKCVIINSLLKVEVCASIESCWNDYRCPEIIWMI